MTRPKGRAPLTPTESAERERARAAARRAILVEETEHMIAMGESRWVAARAVGYQGEKGLLALARVLTRAGRPDLAMVFAAGVQRSGDPYNQDVVVASQAAARAARDVESAWLARFADRPGLQAEDGAAQVA